MLKKIRNLLNNPSKDQPVIYRVCEIIENDLGHFQVAVQIIGKSAIFKVRPEEILADDRLTACFHQHDIRLITYLGYCGINTPQYLIMAKQILKNEDITFAIFDKDTQSIKNTGTDFKINAAIIEKMKAKDAYEIGFMDGRKSVAKII